MSPPSREPGVQAVAAHYGLACLISWLVWLPLVLREAGYAVPVLPLHHYLGAFGPLVAAFLVSGIRGGREAIKALARRLAPWRARPGWLLLALAAPIALNVIAATLAALSAGAPVSLAGLGESSEFPGSGPAALWLLQFVSFGIGEETGWRGFALPALQRRHGALFATLILAALWAAWHAPIFLYRPSYADLDLGGVAGWLISLLAGAVLLTWLFNRSRGSVLVAAMFHASVNFAFLAEFEQPATGPILGALLVLWAVAVIALGGLGRRLGSRGDPGYGGAAPSPPPGEGTP